MKTTTSRLARASASILTAILLASCATTTEDDAPLVLTIVGNNDVHGQIMPREGRGGLVTLSGYVEALRATQDEVLLIDAGEGDGMAITIGRIETCSVSGLKLFALSHNTVRGAAGAAILNAELLVSTGRV